MGCFVRYPFISYSYSLLIVHNSRHHALHRSILRYIREETRYTETRKTVLGILWDTGLL